jgi:hypothetical protein
MAFLRIESTLGFVLECIILYFGFLRVLWRLSLYFVSFVGHENDKVRKCSCRCVYLITAQVWRGTCFIFVVSGFSTFVRLPSEILRVSLFSLYQPLSDIVRDDAFIL